MTRGGNDASGRGGDRSSGNGGGCHDNMPLQACTSNRFNRSARCRQGGQLLRWSCRTNWGGEKEVLTAPPIECKVQLTTANHGMIKLTSVDLKASVLLTHVSQVFNYGADYLGLLKAGLVAGGIVPLEFEKGCLVEDVPLKELLGATTKRRRWRQMHLRIGAHDKCAQYSQRLPPRHVNQPIGVHHRHIHARHLPNILPHGDTHRGRTPPGRSPPASSMLIARV